MNALLRKLLARFLTLGVGEPDDPPTEPASNPPEEPTQEEEEQVIDDLLDAPDDNPPARDDPKERLTAAERRAADLERELAAERAARRAPEPVAARDPEFDREEQELARIREQGDENQLAWAQWRINSDRKIREAERKAGLAAITMEDLADKADFSSFERTNPKEYQAFKDRVEEAVANMRANGQRIPKGTRMAALKFLIGEGILNGKLKAKTTKPAAAGQPQRVERVRMPNARSDVSGRATQSERDKRRARLENQLI
jgi:hypothetical protein